MPELGRPWVSERNARVGHNLGIPSPIREIVEETYAVVGCSDHFECNSAGLVSRLGRQNRLRIRFRLAAPVKGYGPDTETGGDVRLKPTHSAMTSFTA